ncbi:S8 family serine peptidase [Undibacterium sp. Jales W-56]|uniref:S8 family serine peptidase n=1 Tax=Undibacterium sp. Jales W-56 TaxID=2897325 RepID=UPI0021D2A262|nr:S8 family serine peptidase [Undibacterium sp. Jales W-56]MCU6435080.1 S8 family serine peptidase [Undibacterium sp. Jales W-56]
MRNDVLEDVATLQNLRLNTIDRLRREHPGVFELDTRGELIVKHEIIAWSPSVEALISLHAAGFSVVREIRLEALAETILVLQVPQPLSTAAALDLLHSLDKAGIYDYNHLYLGSGPTFASASLTEGEIKPGNHTKAATPDDAVRPKIGLVDAGIDVSHMVFRDAQIKRRDCGNKNLASPHGTAVASLMIGHAAPFSGVLPDAVLYSADIYCGSEAGGSLDKLIEALAWLAQNKVAVINLSIVGPANQNLERIIKSMLAKGYLLVAAVGNDGPAAPPLYPASYPGVIGVTAVDAKLRVLPEAARGAQVMFAAPGSQMLAAAIGSPPYQVVRGTSFASPIVAALLAQKLSAPDNAAAKKAIDYLISQAKTSVTGKPSPDLGYGIVGNSLRIKPEDFR